jgi:glycine cleavage system aminomethyltransferase T
VLQGHHVLKTIGKDIGLLYLPVELAGVGTEVEVEVPGERIIAQVTATLLVDPTGAKLRA